MFPHSDQLEAGVFSIPLETVGYSNETVVLYDERRRQLYENTATTLAPLYRGFGTHYAFIWVGSPPQRVSVIVDTGSHHTAFPCSGCNCGKHMNDLFDPAKSKSSKLLKCNGNRNKGR